MLPGLCPLKKMAESMVISEKKLKGFIHSINYDSMKLYRVNSKIWKGDVVALMPTEKTKGISFTKSYNPSIESFYDYVVGYENYPKRRKRSSSKYYYDRYGNRRQYESHVSESFFSDFMSWLKGDDVEKLQEYLATGAVAEVYQTPLGEIVTDVEAFIEQDAITLYNAYVPAYTERTDRDVVERLHNWRN
jgi:hypothetical protein